MKNLSLQINKANPKKKRVVSIFYYIIICVFTRSKNTMGGRFSRPALNNSNAPQHVVTGVNEKGIRWVRSYKITHPSRQQRIFLVTVPRFAYKAFYNDWTYVPYMKSSVLAICSDIDFPPFHQGFARRWCLRNNPDQFKDYDAFYVGNLSDAVDSNVTRREAYQRFRILRTPLPRMLFLSTNARENPDVHYSYIRKRLHKLVGSQHLYHPGAEFGNSYVVFIPPSQTLSGIRALEEMGFYVNEAIEHEVGEEAKLQKLHNYGRVGNFLILFYLYNLILLLGYALVKHIQEDIEKNREEYLKIKAEMISKAESGRM